MESETSPARHEWVVAISKYIVIDVAKIRWCPWNRLLRHADPFRTLEDKELRVPDVVSFNERAVPGWVSGTVRQTGTTGVIVVERVAGSGNDVSETCSEPFVVGAVLGEYLHVKLRAEIKEPFETDPAKALVANARAGEGNAAAGKVGSGRLSEHGVSANPLHSQSARAEGMAASNKSSVGILAVRLIHVPVNGAENSYGEAGPVIVGVSHPLGANLVIPYLSENVAVAHGNEMEELESTSTGRQG